MAKHSLQFHRVSFSYERSPEEIFNELILHFAEGWTAVAGANGSGKTTLMKLAGGILTPIEGKVTCQGSALYCPQRTDHIPENFENFIDARDRHGNIIKDILEISPEWQYRWETLSHGERKRAQIATALWQEPQVLLIDEPTNHLDAEGREIIVHALSHFRGVGLLVSHDRQLMDDLCSWCLLLTPPSVAMYSGGISAALEQDRHKQENIKKRRREKQNELNRINSEALRRRNAADNADRRRSKKNLAPKDHDGRSKMDLARLTGKDATAGRLLNQIGGRIGRLTEDLEKTKYRKDHASAVWLPGSFSHRKVLVHLEKREISLGGDKRLLLPELFVAPDDRIALTGKNGAGKSTLLSIIIKQLNVPKEKTVCIPQEMDLCASQALLQEVRLLSNEELGQLMTIISCLGSSPARLLESSEPSPGEIRKLMLSLGMLREPHLIIMDEPTNHMDLHSIECLEDALDECPCCLIMVSHDKVFLDRLSSKRWDISELGNDSGCYELTVK